MSPYEITLLPSTKSLYGNIAAMPVAPLARPFSSPRLRS
jgi:hypothetical protein